MISKSLFLLISDCLAASACSLTSIQHDELSAVCDSCSPRRVHAGFLDWNDGILPFFFPPLYLLLMID